MTDAAPSAAPVLRRQRWGLWDIPITLVLSLLFATVAAVLAEVLGASFTVALIAGALSSWIGLAGWPIVVTMWRGNGPRRDLGFTFNWSDVRWGILAGLIGLVVAGIAAALTMAVFGEFNSAAGEAAELLIAQSGPIAWVIFGLLIMIGAPIAEELAFRGLMFSALLKRGMKPWLVIVITSALFAVFHIEPTRIFLLFVIGLVLGFVRYRTNSIGSAIVAHAVINAPAALFVMFGLPELPGMTP